MLDDLMDALLKIMTKTLKNFSSHLFEIDQNFGLEPEKLTNKLYDLIEELMLYPTVFK
jgi:hypothetical protein